MQDMKELIVIQEVKVLIDDDMVEYISQFKWHFDPRKEYLVRDVRKEDKTYKKRIFMHREILGLGEDDGSETDHIDGNRLNNQRSNLRTCTPAQNQWNAKIRSDNTSGYRGVYWEERSKGWAYCIRANGKNHNKRGFEIKEEAARARDIKAIELHGEFAKLNFPREEYTS